MERKKIKAQEEFQPAAWTQAGQKNLVTLIKTTRLPGFVVGKNNLDNYLSRLRVTLASPPILEEIQQIFL